MMVFRSRWKEERRTKTQELLNLRERFQVWCNQKFPGNKNQNYDFQILVDFEFHRFFILRFFWWQVVEISLVIFTENKKFVAKTNFMQHFLHFHMQYSCLQFIPRWAVSKTLFYLWKKFWFLKFLKFLDDLKDPGNLTCHNSKVFITASN